MAGAKIGVVLALDGEQKFSAGVRSAQASVKLCNQELKNLEAESKGSANTLEALTKKNDALRKAQDAYNRTLTAAKEGQSNALKNYREAAARLDELRKKLDAAERELKENGDANEEAAKEAEAYRKAVEKQTTELLKAEASLSNWDTKVAKAEGDVRKNSRAVEENEKALDEARTSADGCATSIDEFGKKISATGEKAEVSSAQVSGMSDASSSLEDRLGGLGNLKTAAVFAGVGAAAVAAGKKLIEAGKAAADYADNILTTSEITGMSTDRIQELTYSAGLMDTELSTIEGAMRKNINSMRSASKGSGDAAASYAKLGVSVKKADGSLRDSEEVFWDAIDALGQIEDRTERDSLAMQLFGKSAQDLNPLIAKGSRGFKELAAEAHEVGYVLDSETLGKLGKAQDSFDRLDAAGVAFQNTLGAAIAPALGGLADLASSVLNGVAGLFRDNRTEAEKFAGSISETAKSLREELDGDWSESAASSVGKLESYRDTLLEVVRAGEADEYQKTQLSKIVEELGSRVPELTAAWDEQTGTLNLTEEAVNSLINAEEEYVQKAALLSARETAFRVKADAIIEQAKAQGLLNAKMKEASKVYGENIETVEDLRDAVDAMYLNPELSGSELHRNMETLLKEAEAAEDAFRDCVPAIEEADKEIEAIGLAAEEMGADLEDASSVAETALGGVEAAAEDAAEGTSSAIQSFADAAVEMKATVQAAFDEAHDSAEAAFSVDAFESWAKDAENGMAKAGEAFEKQAAVLEEYSSNFATVSDALREKEPEFLSYIQDLGKDGAQLVDELAAAFKRGDASTVEELINKYKRAMDAREGIADISAKNVLALKKAEGEFSSTLEEWEGLETAVLKVSNSGLPEELASELFETLRTAKEEGVKIPEGLADAISSSNRPVEAANICIASLKNAISAQKEAVVAAAGEIGSGIGSAIEIELQKKYGPVSDAAAGLINVALIKARARAEIGSPSKLFRREVGQWIPSGLAEGIRDGNTLTAEAASEQMNQTLAAMRKWLKEKRASIEEIGYTWQSVATTALKNGFGISSFKTEGTGKTVQKSANEYASEILSTASTYLSNIKQLYDVSTKEELSYWSSVKAHLQSGTQAWITAMGKVRTLRKQVSKEAKEERRREVAAEEKDRADRLSRMEAYLSHREAMGRLTTKQEKAYWEEQKSTFEKGTAEYKKINEKIVALDKEITAERLASMEAYLAHREAMGNLSTRQERSYWQKHIAEFEKGTAEYKAVQEKLVALEARLVSERLQKYEAYVSRQTALQKMSIAKEKEYWTKRLAEFKKGSDEYKAIEERLATLKSSFGSVDVAASVLSAYQTYYAMSEKAEAQYWANIRKTYKAGTADRLEADRQYIDARERLQAREAEIEEDYASRIEDAANRYKDTVKARRDAIYSAFGLFDEFESSSATGGELLFNLQSQAAGYEEWAKSLSNLEKRGIFSEDLLGELREKGPSDIAAIKALLSLTDEQMSEYQDAYDRKVAAADQQARKENKDLRAEVKAEIKDLKAEMKSALAAVNEPITDELRAVATKIQTVAEDQTAALVAAFTQAGAKVGGSTGESVSSKIQTAAGLTSDQTNGYTQKQIEEAEAASRAAIEAERAREEAAQKARIKEDREREKAEAKRRREEAEKEERKSLALKAIQSAKRLKAPLTVEERKQHAAIYQYIADRYGVAGSASLYTKLAQIFGLPEYKGTGPERMKILEALKAHGLRRGTRSATGGSVWMDEDLETVGPEIIVRKSDKAILTRLEAADAVVPSDLARNLFAWGAINPATINTTALNDRLIKVFEEQRTTSESSVSVAREILGVLDDYLPHLADGTEVRLDTGALVGGIAGEMSKELARRSRRTAR